MIDDNKALGTHQEPFAGIAPTGKAITVTAMHIHRIADGKLIEHGCRVGADQKTPLSRSVC